MNTFEDQLQTSLRHHADTSVGDHAVGLGDVKARAKQIRRRRRGIGAGVAALVAAIAIPGSLALAPAFDRTSEVPPAGPGPEQVATPDHALAGAEELDFRELPLGPDPLIGYLDLTGPQPVVVAAGNETTLDLEQAPETWTRFGDGYAVVTRDEGGNRQVEVLASDGSAVASHPASLGLAVDEEHQQVAWGDPEGRVKVLAAGAEEPRVLGTVPGAVAVEVRDLAGGDCFEELLPATDGGCVASLRVNLAPDGRGAAWVISTVGANDELRSVEGEPMINLADVARSGDRHSLESASYTAVMREIRPDGSCSGVQGHDAKAPETTWLVETCDLTFDTFSPDDRTITTWEAYGDASNHYQMGMYDVAERKVLWERSRTEQEMGSVHSAAWEDDEHVLAPVHQGGRWQVVRIARDGAMERVTDWVEGDETEAPYLLEVQH